MPSIEKNKFRSEQSLKGNEAKMMLIKNFFNKIKDNERILSLDFFINFLSLNDKNEFEKMKRESSKIVFPKSFKEIKHFDGKAEIGVSIEKINEKQSIAEFFTSYKALYDELMFLNSDIAKTMDTLATSLKKEAEIYKKLTLAYISINVFPIYIIIVSRDGGYI